MTRPVTQTRILELWWPLALSWLLMGVELPLVTGVIARLPGAETSLAALNTLVYPQALLLEGPIIMLLAAATALCRDGQSYARLRRFTHKAGLVLTLLHLCLAFTPLFDLVALHLIKVDPELLPAGRLGLQIMTPWTWAIASRRFHQGVMIRAGRSRMIVIGTMVRLGCELGALLGLYLSFAGESAGPELGMVIGTTGIAVGVCAEALFAAWAVRPCLPGIRARESGGELTRRRLLTFYLPLAVTPLMTILLQSIGAATMNRMPEKLASTASWSSVYGLLFLTRTAGFAFNEVVVKLVDEVGGVRELRRFAWRLGAAMTGLLLLVALTPLGELWFGSLIELPEHLRPVALTALLCGVLMPGYSVLQSYYQGSLVQAHKTRGVTEAVVVYLLVACSLLLLGLYVNPIHGIYWTLISFNIAGILQTIWGARRARPVLVAQELQDNMEQPGR